MIRRIREMINISTIRGKFFWLTTTLVIVPMVILSTIFYNMSADKLGSNAKKHAYSSLNMASLYMDQVAKDINDLANVIMGNQELQAILLETDMDDYTYMRNISRISKLMSVYTQSKPFITSYLVYSKNGIGVKRLFRGTEAIAFDYQNRMSEDIAESYLRMLEVNNRVLWLNKQPSEESYYSERMIVGKLLKETEDNYDTLGFLMLEIDKDALFKGLQFLNPSKQSQYFFWDNYGGLVYHMPSETDPILGQEMVNQMQHVEFSEAFDKRVITLDNRDFYGASVFIERTGWTMTTLIEDSILLEDANKFGKLTIQTFMFVLVIGWMIAFLFSNSISRPLRRLRSMMIVNPNAESLQQYRFEASDEVSQIGEKFIRLMEENQKLNDQVFDALLKRKEAEIQVLQAQINPHFLYNTLESLNGFAVMRDQPEMSEVIGALGKFFRVTLSRGNELIPIADEVEHVTSYVKVQQFRFRGKFEWICEIDEEMMHYWMPKLLLQPLVENAIYHGLKKGSGGGVIMLSGHLTDNAVKFMISDDGPGIPEERMKEIVEALSTGESGKIYGLKNVHDRIHMRFGAGYGLELSSQPGTFTTVSITIPFLDSHGQVIDS